MARATSNTALVIIQLGTHESFATLQPLPKRLCTCVLLAQSTVARSIHVAMILYVGILNA